jgi:hypothetical protein
MVKIDSCTFETDSGFLVPDVSQFTKNIKQVPNSDREQIYYSTQYPISGVSQIVYLPDTDKITVSLSGKVLPISENQLITKNNIEQVLETITNSKFIDSYSPELINNSVVRRVDFTENINCSEIDSYLSSVNSISNRKYNRDFYQGKGDDKNKTGVLFRGIFKSFKERLLLYDKQSETKNRHYAGILRIESQRTTFKSIRNDVNGNNNLNDILLSSETPVLNVFKRIIKDNQINPELMNSNLKGNDFQCLLWLIHFKDDMDLIKQQLNSQYSNRSTALNHYKKIERFKRNRSVNNSFQENIKDIINQLSA